MGPERSWEKPWLTPRRLLRSERLPEGFEELYLATFRDLDNARGSRRNAPVASFELIWSPALDRLGLGKGKERSLALDDLIDAHILYRCLTSSLDRAPQLS